MARKMGNGNLSEVEKTTIVVLYQAGLSGAEIARRLGRGSNVPLLYLQRVGLWRRARRSTPQRARQLRGAHLTSSQRKRFARAVASGVTYRELAKRFAFRTLNDARLFAVAIGAAPSRRPRQDKNATTRRCSQCGTTKPRTEFAEHVDRHSNYLCSLCHWVKMTSCKFKISEVKLLAMVRKQKGRCAICRRAEVTPASRVSRRRRNLCLDHNHVTGKIRQLLCSRCNKGIGLFKEDIRRMLAAIEYLQNPPARRVLARVGAAPSLCVNSPCVSAAISRWRPSV